MIEIPEPFVRNTIAREGERGRAWLATLPGLLDELLQRWNRTPAEPIRYGFVGIVVPVLPDAVSAYDTMTALSFGTLLGAPDLDTALLRRIAIFAEAAGLDRARARRWTQARAVIAADWGRRHGDPDWLVDAHDRIAEHLT